MTHRFRTMAKTSTTERGYGYTHAKARQAAAARHRESDPCSRCRRPLGPMGPHLHYDHNDDRRGYRGFAHATCNMRAGAREGSRRSHGRGRVPVPRRVARKSLLD